LSRGYCSIKLFLKLEAIAREKFGLDYRCHKLTRAILEKEFLIEVV
jgi:hypothetical protein